MNMTDKQYRDLSEKSAPKSPLIKNIAFAFLIGGSICTLGQGVINFCMSKGLPFAEASCMTSITLIFLSVMLTGLDVYDSIAKVAGAGTLVPITGFANSIAAPAIEFKTEGYILGMGSKMFVIAGPVLVYGILSSVAAGIIYFLIR